MSGSGRGTRTIKNAKGKAMEAIILRPRKNEEAENKNMQKEKTFNESESLKLMETLLDRRRKMERRDRMPKAAKIAANKSASRAGAGRTGRANQIRYREMNGTSRMCEWRLSLSAWRVKSRSTVLKESVSAAIVIQKGRSECVEDLLAPGASVI